MSKAFVCVVLSSALIWSCRSDEQSQAVDGDLDMAQSAEDLGSSGLDGGVAGEDASGEHAHDHGTSHDTGSMYPPHDAGHVHALSAVTECLQGMTGHDHHGLGHHAHGDEARGAEHRKAMALFPKQEATHRAVKSGRWSDAATWGGEVPGQGALVFIPEGECVVYDAGAAQADFALEAVRLEGGLTFDPEADAFLKLGTLLASPTSVLTIGRAGEPVSGQAVIEVADLGAIDLERDPGQFSRGLVLHGETHIRGQKKEAHLPLELPAEQGRKVLARGSDALELRGDVSGWKVGDELVIMGTKTGEYQSEVRRIASIDGARVGLDAPLDFEHDTPSFQTVNSSGIDEIHIHVGNTTRSVVIRSESPGGVRGHFMIMHSPHADVRYAEFRDLGRTDKSRLVNMPLYPGDENVEGRYALHFHRTGVQAGNAPFVAIGNAVVGSPGWGIVHHDSHGVVNWNVVYNVFGAGIVSEDGNETGEWIGNFVDTTPGHGYRTGCSPDGQDCDRWNEKSGDFGAAGVAYESQARQILQQENIASNASYGWVMRAGEFHLNRYLENNPGARQRMIDKANEIDPGKYLGDYVNHFSKSHFFELYALTFPECLGDEQAAACGHVSYARPDAMAIQYHIDPFQMMDEEEAQFVDFLDNQAIAIDRTVFDSGHRVGMAANTDMINLSKRFVSWRASGFFADNYAPSYMLKESLFIDNFVVFKHKSKTKNNHIIDSHAQDVSHVLGGLSLNLHGVYYNVSQQNVRGIYEPGKRHGGTLIDPPLNQIPHPTLDLDGPLPTLKQDTVHKEGFSLTGTLTDSFGERPFMEGRWCQSAGPDGIYELDADRSRQSDDDCIHSSYLEGYRHRGRQEAFPLGGSSTQGATMKELLKRFGALKREGAWIMPVPLWVSDRYTGDPYPILLDFPLEADETLLTQYELSAYPTIVERADIYNPNVSSDGSFVPTRTYAIRPWRIAIPD